jgi:hypothetical protein
MWDNLHANQRFPVYSVTTTAFQLLAVLVMNITKLICFANYHPVFHSDAAKSSEIGD